MFQILILVEICLLLLWILVEGIYTMPMIGYFILVAGYYLVFKKVAPNNIRGIQNCLVGLLFLFTNTLILSLIFMQVGDYYLNNKNEVSRLGISYDFLVWRGYSLFFGSIIFGGLALLFLFIVKIFRRL